MVPRERVLVWLGDLLVVSDPLEKADVIYVLAGDFFGARVLFGAELGARGYAKQVVLSGGPYGNQYEGDMAVDYAVEHGYPRNLFCAVRLGVPSTMDEARAIGPIFQRMGAKRIILVTSNFHSRRTALVFRLLLPNLRFAVVGTPEKDFDPSSWWKNDHARSLFFSEYKKLIGTLVLGFSSMQVRLQSSPHSVGPIWDCSYYRHIDAFSLLQTELRCRCGQCFRVK